MLKPLSIKIEDTVKETLARKASQAGKSVSQYTSELISEGLEGQQRIDLLIRKIDEEILQLQAIDSIQIEFMKKMFAYVLTRLSQIQGDMNPDERKQYEIRKEKVEAMVTSEFKKIVDAFDEEKEII